MAMGAALTYFPAPYPIFCLLICVENIKKRFRSLIKQ